jgi:hypothetical protein
MVTIRLKERSDEQYHMVKSRRVIEINFSLDASQDHEIMQNNYESDSKLERYFEETQPGPQNLQPWAIKAWNNGLGRTK